MKVNDRVETTAKTDIQGANVIPANKSQSHLQSKLMQLGLSTTLFDASTRVVKLSKVRRHKIR